MLILGLQIFSASYLTTKDLMKLYNEDVLVKGNIYLETYKFG